MVLATITCTGASTVCLSIIFENQTSNPRHFKQYEKLRARTAEPMRKCVEAFRAANHDIEEAVKLLTAAAPSKADSAVLSLPRRTFAPAMTDGAKSREPGAVSPAETARRAARLKRFAPEPVAPVAAAAPSSSAPSTASVSASTSAADRLLRPSAPLRPDQRVQAIIARLQAALTAKWDWAMVDLFGSAATGLSLGALSDVDLCVRLPPTPRAGGRSRRGASTPKQVVHAIADALRRSGKFGSFEVIAHARIPLVRCVDLPSKVQCDVVPGNLSGLQNSKYLAALLSCSPQLRRLALLVKHWAKARGLSSAMHSGLSSFGHVCSVIHFGLAHTPPLVADLLAPDALARAGTRVTVDRVDMTYCPPDRVADAVREADAAWPSTLFETAHRYFAYMAAIDGDHTLSLRRAAADHGSESRGAYVYPKARWPSKSEGAAKDLGARLSLEDPFEVLGSARPHDLGRTLNNKSAKRLHAEWRRAAQLLSVPASDSDASHEARALERLLRDTCAYCGAKNAAGKVDLSAAKFYCEACWEAYEAG
jgi:hypothetical protein